MGALATTSHLGKAFITVHRSITPGFKGDLALLAASGAYCSMHLPGFAKATAPPLQATLLAASRFALQTARQVEFLLTRSECELSAAITTHEDLVLESHIEPPSYIVWLPLVDTASGLGLPAC